jgi:hypothetical protein
MHKRNHTGERGGSTMSLIFTLAIVGALVFTAFKIVPVYVDKYQMQDAIETESRFALASYPKKNADDIRNDVLKKAQDVGVPVKSEDIQVTVTNLGVDISLDYSVPIDLAVTQWAPQFHLHADNHTI